jgi:CHAT domain-containing protein/tetratricopeptide (TPR) repeat protein
MQLTRRHTLKTRVLLIIWVCSCMGVATFFSVRKAASVQTSTADDAQQAFARAETLRADWTKDSLQAAIDHYDKAALLWTTVAEFAKASDARLKSGDVYFLFSEYKQALERYQNAESLAQQSSDWLPQARALSQTGRVQSYLGKNALAETRLTKALKLFEQRQATGTDAYGEALSNLAELSYSKGNFVKALQQLNDALEVLKSDRKNEAKAHLLKGYILGSIGNSQQALVEISQALDRYREIKDKRGEALALTAKGLRYSFDGNQNRAIELHSEARKVFHLIGDRYSEASALNGIGEAYKKLGENSTALPYEQSALELFKNIEAVDGVAATTCGIAEIHFSKSLDQALTYFDRCSSLSRAAGNRRVEAYALRGIAMVYTAQRRPEPALEQYKKIQKFYRSIGDVRGEAMALNAQGDLFLQMNEKQKVLEAYNHASSLIEKVDDKGVLLSTLYNLARVNHVLGSHDTALSLIKQSLDVIENVRSNVGSPEFRASYFSGVKSHYDLCIEILMQLDRLHPGQGFAAEAFFVSETSRARLLIDLLSESRTNLREGAAKEIVDRERTLRGLIQSQAEYHMNLSLSGTESTEIAEVSTQLAELRSAYQTVQAQLREKNPRLFAFEQFGPVELKRIQEELRDSNTLLLEYSLGNERSYLWAITANSLHVYELPARAVIEDAASQLYGLITARQGSDQATDDYRAKVEAADNLYLEKARNLGSLLLGPVAEQLGTQRLLVVPEGALLAIPFDVLPVPVLTMTDPTGASNTLLVETNEVVVLPSASTLIAIRSARRDKASPGKLVAIIADPVLSRSDDRVHGETRSPATAVSKNDPDESAQQLIDELKLARLTHSAEEADAIAAVAPWGTTLVAKGFDASRETVLSSEVSQAQILHFATHNFLDSKRAELSGLVLTMRDSNGVNRNGLVPLPDIYSLDLSAELTVLSACQTALGKEIKGEGLVGLTHSFMSAGSKTVVASLWKVDDRATAVLMAEFYDGILQKGMTPSAALRSAKLKMMRDKQWNAPYYWAGFVLQGEYTNHISVSGRAWLRPGLVLLSLLSVITVGLFVFYKRKRKFFQST